MLSALGDVTGLAVLDAGCGCGCGYYSRLLARAGAAQVVGLDGSVGMLTVARAREQTERLGVSYVHGDLTDAGKVGRFDLVCAVYVLPYARTVDQLKAMCQGAADALRPGGRFVTFSLNPDVSLDREWYAHYGFTMEGVRAGAERRDGAPLILTATFVDPPVRITPYLWGRQRHEDALYDAGFSDIRWVAPRPTAKGVRDQGEQYWEHYTTCAHVLIVEARRG